MPLPLSNAQQRGVERAEPLKHKGIEVVRAGKLRIVISIRDKDGHGPDPFSITEGSARQLHKKLGKKLDEGFYGGGESFFAAPSSQLHSGLRIAAGHYRSVTLIEIRSAIRI